MKKTYTDEEIITAIKSGGKEANKVMEYVIYDGGYKQSFSIEIRKYGLNAADVDDYFQDVLFRFFKNIKAGKFNGKSNLKTYFAAIVRNICLSRFAKNENRRRLMKNVPKVDLLDGNHEHKMMLKEKEYLLANLLTTLGQKCKTILSMSFANYSAQEILTVCGYKNIAVMRKKKSICLTKLRELLSDKPELIKMLVHNE